MEIVDRGAGDPLVLIPGIQGRWEYIEPAVDALAASFRVITFPLCDEPRADAPCDITRGFDAYADQVVAALDARGIRQATICGISFGGLVALRVAARSPERTSALILASTPGPRWHLRRRHEWYAQLPWLCGPLFLAEAPWRLRREVAAAFPDRRARRSFARRQLRTLVAAPLSMTRIAARAKLIGRYDRLADCARLKCPTLVVHGDPALDHVVDASQTSEYTGLIDGARSVTIGGTGHLGTITKPDEFAEVVRRFLRAAGQGNHHSAA